MKRMIAILTALCMLFCGCGAEAPGAEEEAASVQIFAMDTFMELQAYGPGAGEALDQLGGRIKALDSLLSVTDPGSEIYAINHSGSAPVRVSEDTARLLGQALALSKQVGPALDLTLYPVSEAWGFTSGDYRVPDDSELAGLLGLVDDSRVELDGETVHVPDGMELDLGAVAKGYAGEIGLKLLEEHGVQSAILNLGGSSIRTLGNKPDGSPWRIAVQDPMDPSAYAGVLEMGQGAVDTSGGYERYFRQEGEIYWHILDPRTGMPAKSGLISVTVLSEDAFSGDGLSTALFVMGLQDAVRFWRETGGFEFVMIGDGGELYVSEGAAECFTPMGAYENAPLTVISREERGGT